MDFRLRAITIKYFLYLFMVSISIFAVQSYFQDRQAYWLIWTGLGLALIYPSDNFKRQLCNIIFTGLLLAALIFVTGFFTSKGWLLAFYLIVITYFFVFFGRLYSTALFATWVVNLLVIVASSFNVTSIQNNQRIFFILLATLIVLLWQSIFWPYFYHQRWRACVVSVLENLHALNNEIFSCLLQPAYTTNIYLFERRLYLQKEKTLHAFNQLKNEMDRIKIENRSPENNHSELFAQLRLLYDIMLDYSLLRLRVTDHTTFGICAQSLTEIVSEIDNAFIEVKSIFLHKKFHIKAELLPKKIKEFEENDQHVLQVAAREPLAFLLFTASLTAFSREIMTLGKMGMTP